MLRDKIKGLERQIIEMIRNGQDNALIAEKLHRWDAAPLMLHRERPRTCPTCWWRELKHQFPDPAGGDPWSGAARRPSPRCRSRVP